MTEQPRWPITDTPEDVSAPSQGRRQHVLRILLDSMRSMSVAEIAERSGIHLNTARFHLETLVSQGFVEREDEVRSTPGRRKVLYRAAPKGQNAKRARGFRLLAEMLTLVVVEHVDDGPEVAAQAGRRWGRYLTPTPSPANPLSDQEIVDTVCDEMDSLWFAPEAISTADGVRVELNNCPFIEIASAHPDVVCRLHGGLVAGALDELHADMHVSTIIPSARPHQCWALIARGAPAPGESPKLILPVDGVEHSDQDFASAPGLA